MNLKSFDKWYKNANACSIDNCKEYRQFSANLSVEEMHLILRDNRVAFRNLFGKPDSYWQGSEFYFNVWVQEWQGEKFLLFTAKGKGTCIEICDTSYTSINKKSKVIISFVKQLHSRLKPDFCSKYKSHFTCAWDHSPYPHICLEKPCKENNNRIDMN